MSRCKCCNLRLESFDNIDYCKRCIKASEDTTTDWKDPQHLLITNTKQGSVITQPKAVRD